MTTEPITDTAPEDLLRRLDSLQGMIAQSDLEQVAVSRLATLGSLVSMYAHEIGNALTPVLNYTRLALEDPDDQAAARRAHESALRSVERCQSISGALLGFAAGGETDSAPLLAGIERSLACLPRDLAKDGIRLELDIPELLHAEISSVALEQVVLNLVLNARAAMGRGGLLRVTAGCSTWNTPAGFVELRVSDSGDGIDPELLPHIFTPFVTAGGGERGGGHGLGLAICRQLVEDAGGTITAQNNADGGATFAVRLPEPDMEFKLAA